MKCLCKYEWIKLPRAVIPEGKGIMGAWMKLASRAAFRKGIGLYCGHHNAVEPGMQRMKLPEDSNNSQGVVALSFSCKRNRAGGNIHIFTL